MRTKRFQNRITAGRFTLPTAILISVSCWILTAVLLPETETQQSGYSLWETFCDFCIPTWANRLFSFILYAVIGYFLIQLNNTFAIIRMRASVQTSVYFLLISVCPSLHMLYAGDLAAASFLVALFFLFKSYQQARPTGSLFHAFVFIGLGSLLFPQLLYFVPLFYLGMISFRSLSLKSFFAGLTGLCVPYWLFFGYAFYYDKMNLFYHPLQELIHFQPISYGTLGMDRIISCGIITLISLVSSVHYFHVSYLDKVRTRIFLFFLIAVEAWIYLLGILQPQHFDILLQMQVIVGSILTGHLFTLTHNRFTGIFFIITFVLLIVLTIYNLWMQFFNS